MFNQYPRSACFSAPAPPPTPQFSECLSLYNDSHKFSKIIIIRIMIIWRNSTKVRFAGHASANLCNLQLQKLITIWISTVVEVVTIWTWRWHKFAETCFVNWNLLTSFYHNIYYCQRLIIQIAFVDCLLRRSILLWFSFHVFSCLFRCRLL